MLGFRREFLRRVIVNPVGHILMITPRFSPAIGGVEKHVENLSRKFADTGYQVTILTSKHEASLNALERMDRCQVIRMPFGWDRNPFLMYIWFLLNRKLILKHDIIHVHDTIPFLTWYLPLRLLYPLRSVYLTFHGYERDPVPVVFKLLRKVARRLAKRVLCIGRFIEKVYNVSCDDSCVGAVESEEYTEIKRTGAVYIGRLERDTGVERYIQSIHQLEKVYGVKMGFTLCGTGSIENELKDLSKSLGISATFKGIVNNPEEVLGASRFCFAGGYLSILEANASGTPTIAFADSYLKFKYYKSICDAGGQVSIQTTPQGIADEIMNLENNPKLIETISRRGVQYAKQMTWDHMISKYMDLWRL